MCRITALARYARSGGPSDDGRRHLGGYRVGYCVLERHGMHSVVPLRVLLVQAGTTARGPITGRRRDPVSTWEERANAIGCECEVPSVRKCAEQRKLNTLRCPCPCHKAGHPDREGAE
jgi:hypothetical protein